MRVYAIRNSDGLWLRSYPDNPCIEVPQWGVRFEQATVFAMKSMAVATYQAIRMNWPRHQPVLLELAGEGEVVK